MGRPYYLDFVDVAFTPPRSNYVYTGLARTIEHAKALLDAHWEEGGWITIYMTDKEYGASPEIGIGEVVKEPGGCAEFKSYFDSEEKDAKSSALRNRMFTHHIMKRNFDGTFGCHSSHRSLVAAVKAAQKHKVCVIVDWDCEVIMSFDPHKDEGDIIENQFILEHATRHIMPDKPGPR